MSDRVRVSVDRITLRIGVGSVPSSSGGGAGVSDGDKGDVTVSASGAAWTVDAVGGQTASAVAAHVAVAHQPLDADLTAIAALTGTSATAYLRRTAVNTWSFGTPTAADVGALTGTEADSLYDVLGSAADAESNANAYTDSVLVTKQDQDPVLDALVLLSGSGILTQSAPGTFALRTLQTSGGGIYISNAGGVAGDPTISLTGDVAAIEALSGTGWAQRTGANTWTLSTPTYTDVGADADGTASAAVAAHEALGDPHPAYLLESAAATTYQALDAGLASLAGVDTAADLLPYTTGAASWAAATLTAAGRALLDDADASAQRSTLGLEHYTVLVLAADETNSTTTLAMPAALQFVPEAGARYHVEYVLGYTAAATSTGIQHWLAPGNAADGGGWFAARGSGYTSQTVANPTLTSGSFPAFGTSSGSGLTLAWGSAIVVGAASSPTACGVEFASEIAASAVTLKAYCTYLRYRRLD